MTDKIILKAKANNIDFSFSAEQIEAADIVQKSSNTFNLLTNGRSVNATMIKADMDSKHLSIEIDNQCYEVFIQDALDMVVSEMGFDKVAAKQIKEISAPMPGLVLEIVVASGQQVDAGEKILILGAMKMENCITMPATAVVKRITVSVGQAVEKGQVLVELEG